MALPKTSQQYFNSNQNSAANKQWVEQEEGLRDIAEMRFRYALDFKITAIKTLESGTFAIDSTGVKTVTVSHGLSVTPQTYQVQLAVVEVTNVDDWAYNLLKVESTSSSQIVAKINVSTASGTAAATAKLGILVVTGSSV